MNKTSNIHKDIFEAIENNDVHRVKILLADNDEMLHKITSLGSWLHIAANKNRNDIAILLSELGIDLNAKGGPSKKMAINNAAYRGNMELVKYFLEKGALLDMSEPDRNPLFAAIHGGHKNIVELLLDAGIDTKISYSGETMNNMDAIAFAKEWGRTEIAEMLAKHNKST